MKNRTLEIVLLILVAILLVSVCGAFYSFQKNTAPLSTVQPQSSPVAEPVQLRTTVMPTSEIFTEPVLSPPQKSDDNKLWKHYINKDLGVSFSYPDYGKISRVSVKQEEASFGVDIEFQADGSEGAPPYFVTELMLSFIENPEKLSLLNWFRKNVDDKAGSLLVSEAYKISTLPDGREIIMTGLAPIPDAYLESEGGPIGFSSIILSQSGQTVITISPSQDGFRPIPLEQFNKILKTVQAP